MNSVCLSEISPAFDQSSMNEKNNKNRILKGIVVSDKMTKTVVVAVTRLKKHPKYKKYYKVTKRFKAHDEQGHKVGYNVLIQKTKPMSKDKRWICLPAGRIII